MDRTSCTHAGGRDRDPDVNLGYLSTNNLVLCGAGLLVPSFKELQIEAAVWTYTVSTERVVGGDTSEQHCTEDTGHPV